MTDDWGPLSGLAGAWEGDAGLDISYSHHRDEVIEIPFRERATFEPFGPVCNGEQVLFGLDHRTSMWCDDSAVPFHTEVGYWLWDAAAEEVHRAFVVPRGVTVLAGGAATAGATELALTATLHGRANPIGQTCYLDEQASCSSYRASFTIGDGCWSYDEVTLLRLLGRRDPIEHRDRNALSRVA